MRYILQIAGAVACATVVGTNVVAGEREDQAEMACMNAVEAQVDYPSKAEFDYERMWAGGNSAVSGMIVFGVVDLMNIFGAMIPHRYACAVDVRNRAIVMILEPE